ncbi:MAG: 50S ribosomal protein L35 [Negativibacillus sp.]
MPKLKTHTGAKKRFKVTKNGKVKRAHAYKSHLLNNGRKTTKRKRGLRKAAYVDKANAGALKHLLPYA